MDEIKKNGINTFLNTLKKNSNNFNFIFFIWKRAEMFTHFTKLL